MSESVSENIFYVCPNGCEETWFFQDGTSAATRTLTEDGEVMETETYDFTPTTPVKCYKCQAEAIAKIKKVRTTVTVE